MKKLVKILPLVLALPLLVGCGKNVKAPKFADYGSKLSADDFETEITKVLADSSLSKEAALPSMIMKKEYKLHLTQKEVFNKKKTFVYDRYDENKAEAKYDANNATMSASTIDKGTDKSDDALTDFDQTIKYKNTYYYQGAKVEDKEYLVSVDSKHKQYSPEGVIGEGETVASVLDAYVKDTIYNGLLDNISYYAGQYANASDEEKKFFSFYQNGNIFTLVYEYHSGNHEFKIGDDVIAMTEENNKIVVQSTFADGDFKSIFYLESTEHIDYKSDYYSGGRYHPKGSVYDKDDRSYTVMTAKNKDVKVKAADLSKYAKVGF